VSLDPRDSDSITLLTYLAIALDRIESLDPSVFAALSLPGTSIWLSVIPRLGAACATRSDPFVIVLDDVHRLEGRESLDAIAAIANYIPAGCSLVLSGRVEPELGLPLLRAQGRSLELGAEDLSFDEDEAATVLGSAGVELRDRDVDRLIDETEGWPAGLYLAVLWLRARGSQADVTEFVGADRFVGDYFREELLSHLSDAQVDFLVSTSVLGRMCGPLCDAVLERTDSAAMLEALERENLFVVPLDHRREWYRFHHLFRELLQAELARQGQERVRALNRRT
jgi:LuxR family maltose regulon positive regulatory protein